MTRFRDVQQRTTLIWIFDDNMKSDYTWEENLDYVHVTDKSTKPMATWQLRLWRPYKMPSTTSRELKLLTLGDEDVYQLRPTTGDEEWVPTHGDPHTAQNNVESLPTATARGSSTTTRGPELVIQVCDDVVRRNDFPRSLPPFNLRLHKFASIACWRPPADRYWWSQKDGP